MTSVEVVSFSTVVAMALTGIQSIVMMVCEKSVFAFAVELRIAYLLLLFLCFVPSMRWLY